MAGAGSDRRPAAPVVVTGADGFVGRAVVARWSATGRPFRAQVRRARAGTPDGRPFVVVADLATAPEAELDALVAGAGAVLHLAGRAHVLAETAADPDAAYRQANVEATRRLACAAVRAGVPRFVLASSVKVSGEASRSGQPLRAGAPPAPQDAYARSKAEAERALDGAVADTCTAALVLRLPLVYGPGVRANFAALLDAVARRRLLPLGASRARRHLLYTGNAVAAFDAALEAVPAPTGTFFVADEPAIAVADLVRAIGDALGVPARLVGIPLPLLRLAGRLAGRSGEIGRLTSPLEIDTASFRAATGYAPPYTLAEGLAETAAWWRVRHAF